MTLPLAHYNTFYAICADWCFRRKGMPILVITELHQQLHLTPAVVQDSCQHPPGPPFPQPLTGVETQRWLVCGETAGGGQTKAFALIHCGASPSIEQPSGQG